MNTVSNFFSNFKRSKTGAGALADLANKASEIARDAKAHANSWRLANSVWVAASATVEAAAAADEARDLASAEALLGAVDALTYQLELRRAGKHRDALLTRLDELTAELTAWIDAQGPQGPQGGEDEPAAGEDEAASAGEDVEAEKALMASDVLTLARLSAGEEVATRWVNDCHGGDLMALEIKEIKRVRSTLVTMAPTVRTWWLNREIEESRGAERCWRARAEELERERDELLSMVSAMRCALEARAATLRARGEAARRAGDNERRAEALTALAAINDMLA